MFLIKRKTIKTVIDRDSIDLFLIKRKTITINNKQSIQIIINEVSMYNLWFCLLRTYVQTAKIKFIEWIRFIHTGVHSLGNSQDLDKKSL